MARYEIRDAGSEEVLSRHRTRQAAVDNWRKTHAGTAVRIVRTYSTAAEHVVVVEGTWHGGGPGENDDNPLAR